MNCCSLFVPFALMLVVVAVVQLIPDVTVKNVVDSNLNQPHRSSHTVEANWKNSFFSFFYFVPLTFSLFSLALSLFKTWIKCVRVPSTFRRNESSKVWRYTSERSKIKKKNKKYRQKSAVERNVLFLSNDFNSFKMGFPIETQSNE